MTLVGASRLAALRLERDNQHLPADLDEPCFFIISGEPGIAKIDGLIG